MKRRMEDGKKANPSAPFNEAVKGRIAAFGGEEQMSWIYGNDIEGVWNSYIEARGN